MTINNDSENKRIPPPTMSPVTFERFVETHRRTLPGRIDRTVMPSMSGGDQTKIISGLHFMKLTDPSTNVPTALFARLKDAADDESARKSAWSEVLREAYPMAFAPPFELMTATQGQLNENFTTAFGINGDSVRKATAFFISLARVAGIPLSGYFRQTRVRAVGQRTPGTKKEPKRGTGSKGNDAGATSETSKKSAADPQDGSLGLLAATWRLPNGVVARLYVNGDPFAVPKTDRDNLFKIADTLKKYDAESPASKETEPAADGVAAS